MKPVLVDTGFLIGLFDPTDSAAQAASRYLRDHHHPLLTAFPVVVETCFFLAPSEKIHLLTWVSRGGLAVADVPLAAYPHIESTLRKFADRDLDLADAALVWLASHSGSRQILTVDRADFQLFRLKGGRRFDLIDWL